MIQIQLTVDFDRDNKTLSTNKTWFYHNDDDPDNKIRYDIEEVVAGIIDKSISDKTTSIVEELKGESDGSSAS